jgi:hypothetical protein
MEKKGKRPRTKILKPNMDLLSFETPPSRAQGSREVPLVALPRDRNTSSSI